MQKKSYDLRKITLIFRYFDWLECKLCLRKALKKKWHFDCTCLRCQSPDDLKTFISAPKCQACLQDDKTGYLIPGNASIISDTLQKYKSFLLDEMTYIHS